MNIKRILGASLQQLAEDLFCLWALASSEPVFYFSINFFSSWIWITVYVSFQTHIVISFYCHCCKWTFYLVWCGKFGFWFTFQRMSFFPLNCMIHGLKTMEFYLPMVYSLQCFYSVFKWFKYLFLFWFFGCFLCECETKWSNSDLGSVCFKHLEPSKVFAFCPSFLVCVEAHSEFTSLWSFSWGFC